MQVRTQQNLITLFISFVVLFCSASQAHTLELFAKASASKNYTDEDRYTISVSGGTGLALLIFSGVRIEGRYTVVSSLQNRLDVGSPSLIATLNDIKTETNIYSVGLDIDIVGEKYVVQPFVFLGAGYIVSNRSYYLTPVGSSSASLINEPETKGISANLGAGIRIRIAKTIAFEVEAYGYGLDPHKPNPLINIYGNAGIRIFM